MAYQRPDSGAAGGKAAAKAAKAKSGGRGASAAVKKPPVNRDPGTVMGPRGMTRVSPSTQSLGQAPISPPSPPAPPSGGSSGYSGGSVGVSPSGGAAGLMQAPAAAPAPQPMSDEDWWKQDADYQTEEASLKSVLDNAMANLALKRSSYDTDFVSTLKNLGWDWQGDDQGSLDGMDKGQWDPTNKLGAYGSGFQNLNNDFASRSMMDSSFFGDAMTNFNTDFNNQFSELGNQRGTYLKGVKGDETAANDEFKNALARARAQSLARRDVAI